MDNEALSIFHLNELVKNTLKNTLAPSYWVVGEISEININPSGHCYLELIEKSSKSDTLVAKARATIWASTFRMIKPYFETATGQALTAGIKIMVKITVEFHELYGYSLNIRDIEPGYTVGELALQKQKIIRQLEEEGVIHMNRELTFPELPQNIAVISSKTAAGYEDFMDQLLKNPYGYKFYPKLFPALMQGSETESSIIKALERIYAYEDFFDVVVIIRGGGAKSDLNSFNSYWLAYNIAQFPLPVIAGIGHEQDESIVDLVAHSSLKTPTAVAEFLISRLEEFENYVAHIHEKIYEYTSEYLQVKKEELVHFGTSIQPKLQRLIFRSQHKLGLLKTDIQHASDTFLFRKLRNMDKNETKIKSGTARYVLTKKFYITRFDEKLIEKSKIFIESKKNKFELLIDKNTFLDPLYILKRGYSVTRKEGKLIKRAVDVKENDIIETILFEGKIKSRIEKQN
ncbi:MAG: exodeoxyribonuclease VII large subunit [Bacteroidales bacterium]|nr:exodeoxyribonuclease VII large subunit [Bacteroidales bacterium]